MQVTIEVLQDMWCPEELVVNKMCATAATGKYKTIKYLQLAQTEAIKEGGR